MPEIDSKVLWAQFAPVAAQPANQPSAPSANSAAAVAAILSDFARRISNMENVQKLSVQKDQLISAITLTPEAVLISSEKVGVLGEVIFADWLRDINGISTGVIDPRITTIRGGVIRTGKVQSFDGNSWLDLDATGATAFLKCQSALTITAAGDATFAGTVESAAGTIGGWSLASTSITATGSGGSTVTLNSALGKITVALSTTKAELFAQDPGTGTEAGLYVTVGLTKQVDAVSVGGAGRVVIYDGSGVAAFSLMGSTGNMTMSGGVVMTNSTANQTASTAGMLSHHGTHNLASGDYKGAAVPVTGTGPFLYINVGGKVCLFVDSAGATFVC